MKKYLKYILHAVILIGLGLAAARYLNGEEVLQALGSFEYIYALPMVVLSTAYILLKAWRFVVLMRPLTDVSWVPMVKGYVAGTAATLLPGGVYARAGLMSQAGIPVEKSSAPVAYSSLLDQAMFVLGSLIAALWLEAARGPALILLLVLAAIGLVLWLPFTRRLLSRLTDWIANKFKVLEEWRTFLRSMVEVATPRILIVTFALTIVGLILQIVTLDLALRGFGLSVSYPILFLAYIVPTFLGRNSAIPGGVGVTEASMVGFLAATAGIDLELGTAATAVFRIATVFLHAFQGALVYFFLWRGDAEGKPAIKSEGGAQVYELREHHRVSPGPTRVPESES